jgi:hypothetical protein
MPSLPLSSLAEEKKSLDFTVNLLQEKIINAREISDNLYQKVNAISVFQLDSDKKEDREKFDNCDLVTTFRNLINDLEHLNQRNAEIVKQLNTLI